MTSKTDIRKEIGVTEGYKEACDIFDRACKDMADLIKQIKASMDKFKK